MSNCRECSKKRSFLVTSILSEGSFFSICFISIYSVLNKHTEYRYIYISKNITSYTFVACF